MGHGHRNMFHLTGLPGWMRFGYSPGWGGMPPGAQYLSETGQSSEARDWFAQRAGTQAPTQAPQAQPVPQPSYPAAPQSIQQPQISREQEIRILEDQVQALEDQIGQIRDRIKQLRE